MDFSRGNPVRPLWLRMTALDPVLIGRPRRSSTDLPFSASSTSSLGRDAEDIPVIVNHIMMQDLDSQLRNG